MLFTFIHVRALPQSQAAQWPSSASHPCCHRAWPGSQGSLPPLQDTLVFVTATENKFSHVGLFCTVPTLKAELWVYWGWERCPHSQAVPWDVAGRGELLAAGFVFQGVPWLSLLSPTNPRLQQAVHRPRGEVCPHLGKAGRKRRGGVILEVNGKIDL